MGIVVKNNLFKQKGKRKMSRVCTQQALENFVRKNSDSIEYVETRKVEETYFNIWMGQHYMVKVRLHTTKDYHDMLFTFETCVQALPDVADEDEEYYTVPKLVELNFNSIIGY